MEENSSKIGEESIKQFRPSLKRWKKNQESTIFSNFNETCTQNVEKNSTVQKTCPWIKQLQN